MEDIFIRCLALPYGIEGLTIIDPDGNYNVYINSNCSHKVQLRALEHEMEHIRQSHFYSDSPVSELELFAENRRFKDTKRIQGIFC